jgi:hypothetical protein
LLGIGLIDSSINESKISNKEHEYQQAYFIAKAGAEATADFFYRTPNSDESLEKYLIAKDDNILDNMENYFGGGSFKFGIMAKTGSTDLIVESICEYNGIEKKIRTLLKQEAPFGNYAALTVLNQLTIEDGFVKGNLMGPNKDKIYIKQDESFDEEKYSIIYKQLTYKPPKIESTLYDLYDNTTLPLKRNLLGNKEFDPTNYEDYDYTATNDLSLDLSLTSTGPFVYVDYDDDDVSDQTDYYYLGDLDLNAYDFNFDLGSYNKTVKLVFNKLAAKGNMNITGTGKLIINVQEADLTCLLTTDSNAMLELSTYLDIERDNDPNNDDVEEGTLTERNNPYGEIYIKTGNSGAENLYVYAPDKTVKFGSNTVIYGAAIANDVIVNQGTTEINYVEPNYAFTGHDIGFYEYTYKPYQSLEIK